MAERHLTAVPDESPRDVVEQFREQNLAALHDLMFELSHPPAFLREWADQSDRRTPPPVTA